jgi:ParB-like chromosome segregation protein Spo0J
MEERASRPTQLLLKEIKTDEATFQWRVSQFNKVESAEHLRVLTQALQNSNKPLDPLQVFQKDDDNYYVMEGHHRLAAYRKARWKKPIPVTVFEGTLDQAQLAALAANVKDKLRLSGPEKREAAWRLITHYKHLKLSKAEIAEKSGTAPSTVANMRKVERALLEGGKDPKTYTWTKARSEGPENAELSADEWRERKAKKIVDALLKAKIGQGLSKDPEVTALALQMLNPSLPAALVRQWWMDDPDLKSELAEELRQEEANPFEGLAGPGGGGGVWGCQRPLGV